MKFCSCEEEKKENEKLARLYNMHKSLEYQPLPKKEAECLHKTLGCHTTERM